MKNQGYMFHLTNIRKNKQIIIFKSRAQADEYCKSLAL